MEFFENSSKFILILILLVRKSKIYFGFKSYLKAKIFSKGELSSKLGIFSFWSSFSFTLSEDLNKFFVRIELSSKQ